MTNRAAIGLDPLWVGDTVDSVSLHSIEARVVGTDKCQSFARSSDCGWWDLGGSTIFFLPVQ